MRECDIHHTRSIKTNSNVNLSRQPGLDLCYDLLQHLQGVLRTCRKHNVKGAEKSQANRNITP